MNGNKKISPNFAESSSERNNNLETEKNNNKEEIVNKEDKSVKTYENQKEFEDLLLKAENALRGRSFKTAEEYYRQAAEFSKKIGDIENYEKCLQQAEEILKPIQKLEKNIDEDLDIKIEIEDLPRKVCPKCGQWILKEDKICRECGANLNALF